jgi:hypothetical protein
MLWISMFEFCEGAHSLMRMNFPALDSSTATAGSKSVIFSRVG